MGYILRRFFTLLITLWLVSLVTFVILQVIPGDPAQLILGTEAPPEALRTLRVQLGLDRPWPLRYLAWLGGALRGDLGVSLRQERPVASLIAERLPVTLSLACLVMLIALALSLPLGILAAVRWRSPLDYAVLVLSQVGVAVPSFWLGIVLILAFGLGLRVLPTGGYVGWAESPAQALRHLALPSLSLGLVMAALLTRMTRAAMLEVLGQGYVLTARAKGLRERAVVMRHALKNALIPVVTLVGLQFGFLVGGSIVIEQVFALPGVGRLLLTAIYTRDLPLIQGIVLFVTTGVVVSNFLVDALYAFLDPRIRVSRGGAR